MNTQTYKAKYILIGADKGGVGKTTVARILHDYMKERNIPTRYFDTQYPGGDLKQFVKGAVLVDMSEVSALMQVFDQPPQNELTIIDLQANILLPVLKELKDAEFFSEEYSKELNLTIIHVLGPTITSLGEIATAAEQIGSGAANHYLVKNHINKSTFFEWDADQANSPLRHMQEQTIVIPQLEPLAAEYIQKQAIAFTDFAADQKQSKILRGRVNHWIKDVFAEFDRIKLTDRDDA